jgi:hypothetical protein
MDGKCKLCNKGGIEIMHSNEHNIQVHPACIDIKLKEDSTNPLLISLAEEFDEAIKLHRIISGESNAQKEFK